MWPTFSCCRFSLHVSPTEIPPAWSPPQEAETAVIGRDQCRCQYERLMELLNSSHITDKLMCAQRDGQEGRLCLVSLQHVILLCIFLCQNSTHKHFCGPIVFCFPDCRAALVLHCNASKAQCGSWLESVSWGCVPWWISLKSTPACQSSRGGLLIK